MKLGLQRLLTLGFAAAVIAIMAFAFASYRHFRIEQANVAQIARTQEAIVQSHRVLLLATASQAAIRGFGATGQMSYLNQHRDALAKIAPTAQALRELVADYPAQRLLCADVERTVTALLEWRQQVEQEGRQRGAQAAGELISSGRGTELMQRLQAALETMEAEGQREQRARLRSANLDYEHAHAATVVLFAVVVALLITCYVLVRHLLAARQKVEGALRELTTTLDERVRERTAQLATANAGLQRASEEQQRIEGARRSVELRFRALVDQATDAMFVHDGDGLFLDVNQSACAGLGYSRETLLGMRVFDVACDLDPAVVRQTCLSLQPGQPVTVEGQIRRRDGSTFPADIRVGCHEFQGQRLFIALVRDVTDRRRTEESLAQEAARRRILFEESPDGILLINPETAGFVEFNASAHRMLGYTREEFAKLSIFAIEAVESAEETKARIAAVVRGGRVDFETKQRTKQGELRDVYVTAKLVDVLGGSVCHCVWRDITTRKKAETALLASEERLRFALETSQTGAWDLDLVDHTAFRSLEHDRIFGYAELLPKWTYEMFLEHVVPADRASVDDKFQRATKARGDWSFECRIRRTDGEIRWIWAAGRHRIGATGAARRMAGIVQDITTRKEAERAHAHLAAIVESTTDAIVSVTPDWRVATWNHAAEHLLGFRADEIIGRSALSILVPPDRQQEMSEVVDHLNQGQAMGPYETFRRHKDGRSIPVAVTASPIRDSSGQIIGGSAILRDISVLKRLEAEVLRVSDYEQQRLGHDLHDGIGQQLTAIELMLHQLDVQPNGAGRTAKVEQIARYLRATIREVRTLAHGLAPFILDSGGLHLALSELVDSPAGQVRCRLVSPRPIRAIGNEAATQLYRIAQEAFNNALKHSGASEIEIRLLQRDDALQLEVTDNGRGLLEAEQTGGGLQIMRYRASLLGAKFYIQTRPGGGTTIGCALASHP